MNASGIFSATLRMSHEVKLGRFGSSLDLGWVGRSWAISQIWFDWAFELSDQADAAQLWEPGL